MDMRIMRIKMLKKWDAGMMIKGKKMEWLTLNKKRATLAITCLFLFISGTTLAQNLPGSTPSSYSVGPNGSFQYQIPIVLPAGTNSVQPNLSLGFSSGGSNGSVGLGWGISGLSSINRCAQTIARDGLNKGVQHSSDDRFCLNGSPLIVTKGAYGDANSEYRTEIDGFSRIVASTLLLDNVNGGQSPKSFRVFLKNGTFQDFGYDADSRFVLPDTQSVESWSIGRVYDQSGNYYRVRYEASEGLPTVIEYTHNDNAGQQGSSEVRFIYDTVPRPDTRIRYRFGSKIIHDKRLERIDVTRSGVSVRSYDLEYELSPLTRISRLTSVTECGMNDECFRPTVIAWEQAEAGMSENATHSSDLAPSELIEYRFVRNSSNVNSIRSIQVDFGEWIDVNGDGRVDQVRGVIDTDGNFTPKTYIQTDDGWTDGTDPTWIIPHPLRSYDLALTSTSSNRFRGSVASLGLFKDVNNDGMIDIVYSYDYFSDAAQNSPSAQRTMKKTYLNTGNGWQESAEFEPADILFDYVSNRVGDDGMARTGTIRAVLMDVNGDDLPDWVNAYHVYDANGDTSEHKATWLNTGNGWESTADVGYEMPDVFVEYSNGFRLEHGEFVDVNGDGLVDWVQGYQRESDDPKIGTWINTGSGWQPNSDYDLPPDEVIFDNERGFEVAASTRRGSFVDVNGDGLSDWVRSYAAGPNSLSNATFLNTGRGWVRNINYQAPFIHLNQHETFDKNLPMEIHGTYMDVNRDGLIDFLESYISINDDQEVRRAWLNGGIGWIPDSNNTYKPEEVLYDYTGTSQRLQTGLTFDSRLTLSKRGHFVDINNDGVPDWVNNSRFTFKDIVSSNTNVSVISTLLAPEHSIEQLLSVTTNTGVVIKPTLVPLTSDDDVYTKGENEAELNAQHLIAPIYVVSQLEVSRPDDLDLFNTRKYFYEAAQFSSDGRGSLGFKVFRQVDVDKGITNRREYRQDFPFVGRLVRSQIKAGGKILSSSVMEYDQRVITHTTNDGISLSYFPFVASTSSYRDELNGTNSRIQNQSNEFSYDDFGNVLTSRAIVSDANNNILSDITTANIYKDPVIDTDRWLVGLVANTTINIAKDIANPNEDTITRYNEFSYNDRGLVTESIREPNQSEAIKLTTRFTYDSFGNIMTQTVSDGAQNDRVTSMVYDESTHSFPVIVSNAKSQISMIDYHPQCGLPERTTDANGLVSEVEYDDFCRVVSATGPDNVETTTSYLVGSQQCLNCQTTAAVIVTEQTTGQVPVTVYLNAYGQEMVSSTVGMLNETIIRRTEYDLFGRVLRQSQPFFETDSEYYTEFEYDVLDRNTVTEFSFLNDSNLPATNRQDYSVDVNGHSVLTTTDIQGRVSKAVSNALGQIVEVVDADNKSLHHRYDARSLLTQTIDPQGNTIDIDYDILGRRISLNDPDLGLSTYLYNAFDELISQTDAKDQTTTQAYDKLGRLVQRVVPEVSGSQSGGISSWTYDIGVNAIGQLSSVVGVNGYAEEYTYDGAGRLSAMQTTVRGESFQQSYSYNENGQLASKRYPDSGTGNEFGVRYRYVNGYLSSITDRENDVTGCIEHWRANKYDALNRLTADTLGTIVTSTRDFDPAKGVLNSILSDVTLHNVQTAQDLSYTYDEVNNMLSRNDDISGVNEVFSYDTLDRLLSYDNGTDTTLVNYDDLGNITYKSDVGTYNYSGDGGPHAVSRVDLPIGDGANLAQFQVNWEWDGETFLRELPSIHGQNFSYDDNGNTTQSGNRSLYWTGFDKPFLLLSQKNNGEQSGSYIEYDADQQRVYKQEGVYTSTGQLASVKERTVYVGEGYQRITNQSGVTHRYTIITQGNTVQIDRADGTEFNQTKYLLSDTLGSVTAIVNTLGEIEQNLAFDPWGMSIETGSSQGVNAVTNIGFTGQEMDHETSLVNMNARIYDPYLGRFLSADPVLPDAFGLQSYNRYSYVINNPLKYTDPTGNVQIGVSSTGAPIETLSVTGTRSPRFSIPSSDGFGFNAFDPFEGVGITSSFDTIFDSSNGFNNLGPQIFTNNPFNPLFFLETPGVNNVDLAETGSAGVEDQFNRGSSSSNGVPRIEPLDLGACPANCARSRPPRSAVMQFLAENSLHCNNCGVQATLDGLAAIPGFGSGARVITGVGPLSRQIGSKITDIAGSVRGLFPAAKGLKGLKGLQSQFDDLANAHLLPQFRKLDPNLTFGITGSFKTGLVGNPSKARFGKAIDLNDFDVDFFIKSDVLFKEFGKNLRANPEFRKILSNTPGFEGLRANKKGFSIKFLPSSQ